MDKKEHEHFTSPGNVNINSTEDLLYTNRYVTTEVAYDTGNNNKQNFRKYIEDKKSTEQRDRDVRIANKLSETDLLLSNEYRRVGNAHSSFLPDYENENDRYNKPHRTTVTVHSRNRDKDLYPKQNHYKINLTRQFNNVKSVRLVSTEMPNTEQTIKDYPLEIANNRIYWIDEDDNDPDCIYEAILDPGNYDAISFARHMESKMNSIIRASNGRLHQFDVNIDLDTDIASFQLLKSDLLTFDAISTTAGSNIININHIDHGFKVNDVIIISGARDLAGITANTLNGTHTIVTVPDENNYRYIVQSIAGSTTTGGGGTVQSGKENNFKLLFSNKNTPAFELGFPWQDSSSHVSSLIEFIDTAPQNLAFNDPEVRHASGTVPAWLTSTNHGLVSGDTITIRDANTIPDINGKHVVTNVIDENRFEIGKNIKLVNNQTLFKNTDVGKVIASNDTQFNLINDIILKNDSSIGSATNHNLAINDTIYIAYTDTTPSINGIQTVTTLLSPTLFNITTIINLLNSNTGIEEFVHTSSTTPISISSITPQNNGIFTVPSVSTEPFEIYVINTDTVPSTNSNVNGLLTVSNYDMNNGSFDTNILITIVNSNPSNQAYIKVTPGDTILNVSSITKGSNGLITSAAHGLSNGDLVFIAFTDTSPSIRGVRTVTVFDANRYETDIDITTVLSNPATQAWVNTTDTVANSMQFIYRNNNGLLFKTFSGLIANDVLFIRNSNTTTTPIGGINGLQTVNQTFTNNRAFDLAGLTIDNVLLFGEYLKVRRNGVTAGINGTFGTIISITAGSPTTITTTGTHSINVGGYVYIQNSGTTPSIDGLHQVSITGVNTFTIPVLTAIGSVGVGEWFESLSTSFVAIENIFEKQTNIIQSNTHGLIGGEKVYTVNTNTSTIGTTLEANIHTVSTILDVNHYVVSSIVITSVGSLANAQWVRTTDTFPNAITSVTSGDLGSITTSVNHGYNVGDDIFFEDISTTPELNQTVREITEIVNATTFRVGIKITNVTDGIGSVVRTDGDNLITITSILPQTNGIITTTTPHNLIGLTNVYIANSTIVGFIGTQAAATPLTTTTFETNIPIVGPVTLTGGEEFVLSLADPIVINQLNRKSNGALVSPGHTLSINDQVFIVSLVTTDASISGVQTVTYVEPNRFELDVEICSIGSATSYSISASSPGDINGKSTVFANGHAFEENDVVTIVGHLGALPNINGIHIITEVIPGVSFKVPVNVQISGAGGTATNNIEARYISIPVGSTTSVIQEIGDDETSTATEIRALAHGITTNKILLCNTDTVPDINGIHCNVTIVDENIIQLDPNDVKVSTVNNAFSIIVDRKARWSKQVLLSNAGVPEITIGDPAIFTTKERINPQKKIAYSISNSIKGNIVTIQASGHSFKKGDNVLISGHAGVNPELNGNFVVLAVTPDITTNIISSSATNPTVITTDVMQMYKTNDLITISGHTNIVLNGTHKIIAISPTEFSIPINSTIAGTGGTTFGGASLKIPKSTIMNGVGGFVTGDTEPCFGHGLNTDDYVVFRYLDVESDSHDYINDVPYKVKVLDDCRFTVSRIRKCFDTFDDLSITRILKLNPCRMWGTNILEMEFRSHGLVDGDIIFLYEAETIAGIRPRYINTIHNDIYDTCNTDPVMKTFNQVNQLERLTRKIVRVIDDNHISFLVRNHFGEPLQEDFTQIKEFGGGFNICVCGRNRTSAAEKASGLKDYGFDGLQNNINCNGRLNRTISLEGELFIFMKNHTLSGLIDTGIVDDIFAKILWADPPGTINYNTFVTEPKIFEEPLRELNELELEFVRPDGIPFNFNGIDHSFSLEIFEYNYNLMDSNVSSLSGVTDRGLISQIGLGNSNEIKARLQTQDELRTAIQNNQETEIRDRRINKSTGVNPNVIKHGINEFNTRGTFENQEETVGLRLPTRGIRRATTFRSGNGGDITRTVI